MWTYILTDAFDTADTAASFVFRYKVTRDADASKLKFLRVRSNRRLFSERDGLAGSLTRDV